MAKQKRKQKKKKSKYIQTGVADREAVIKLTNHLIEAYEAYIEEHGLTFLDGFMSAHNFHAAIVLHLESLSEHDGLWIKQAIATFEEKMNKSLKKKKTKTRWH